MGYVGTAPLSGDYRKLDDISSGFNASTTEFTLQVGSVNVTPAKATAVLISVGGILQEPVSAYDISGSTITFTAAPAAGADFFGVMLGAGVDIGTPGDDTVTSAKIADNAVTLAKMASGTDGNIISFDASGNPVAVATGTDGQVLTSAGAGAPPAFEDAAGGSSGITEADQWRLNANFTDDQDPITANLERVDTAGFGYLGTGMTQSSGVFSFPSTGYWLITFITTASHGATDNSWNNRIVTTVDNSTWVVATRGHSNSYTGNTNAMVTCIFLFDVTAVATHKVRFGVSDLGASDVINGSSGDSLTYMTFLKLGETD